MWPCAFGGDWAHGKGRRNRNDKRHQWTKAASVTCRFHCRLLNLWNFLEASQLVLLDTRQQKALVVFGQNHGTFYHKWLQGIDCGPIPFSKLTLPIMLTLPQEPLDALLSEVPTDLTMPAAGRSLMTNPTMSLPQEPKLEGHYQCWLPVKPLIIRMKGLINFKDLKDFQVDLSFLTKKIWWVQRNWEWWWIWT